MCDGDMCILAQMNSNASLYAVCKHMCMCMHVLKELKLYMEAMPGIVVPNVHLE